jgi:hypothetical protein
MSEKTPIMNGPITVPLGGELTRGDPVKAETFDTSMYQGIQGRALALLGDGIQQSIVAQTLGVTESYISQLLADENFRNAVVEKRYNHLQKYNVRDAAYDKIEDKLLDQLEKMLPMLMDPMKIAKVLSTINAAKRRGQSAPESIVTQNTVVQLTMPIAVLNRFKVTKDANNQIIEAGEQSLVTIQSGSLMDRVKAQNEGKQNGTLIGGIESPRSNGITDAGPETGGGN